MAAAAAWPDVAGVFGATPPAAGVTYAYGTAGFRMEASLLPAACVRTGALAAVRALQQGKAVGVMITASHNPVADNGMKVVDADGGMLAMAWEVDAAALANAAEPGAELARIAKAAGVSADTPTAGALVVVGCDTRPSSAGLRDLVVAGVAALGVAVEDIGVVPTPVVHHVVRCTNATDPVLAAAASVEGYYSFMVTALEELLLGVPAVDSAPLAVDCACGVGAVTVRALAGRLPGGLQLALENDCEGAEPARLNNGVGAEHVQKKRLPPAGFESPRPGPAASVDGDADRVVFHYYAGEEWRLLDGDAISALAAAFVGEQLAALGWTGPDAPSVGVVQTAYANGASSAYIEGLGLPRVVARTGVKYVHHAATAFDIGIYFEANGHGTVLIAPEVAARAAGVAADESADPAARTAGRRLAAAARLVNQAVGDAVSDALFCEAVLRIKGWGLPEWDALYSDLPSKQDKVRVPDRSAFVPNATETRLTAPEAVQAGIDAAVAAAGGAARAFVRPSGTEDVVRIYAEADSAAAAAALAEAVKAAVLKAQ